MLIVGHQGVSTDLLDIIESPPDTSTAKLNIHIRFHIIKIREIRAVHNVADLIFVAVQTWHLPELQDHFKNTPDHARTTVIRPPPERDKTSPECNLIAPERDKTAPKRDATTPSRDLTAPSPPPLPHLV